MSAVIKPINLTEPLPQEWFDSLKINELKELISSSYQLLSYAEVIDSVIDSWIKLKVVQEQSIFSGKDPLNFSSVQPNNINLEDFNLLIHEWSSRTWNTKIQTLFLRHRQSLDSASCRVLRVKDKGLAQELYHRIKAEESTFGEVAYEYGYGHERYSGGLYPLQPVSKLPSVIATCIQSLQIGQVSKPIKAGSFYFILQINEYHPAKFDQESYSQIYNLEFADWLVSSRKHLLDHLESTTHSSEAANT